MTAGAASVVALLSQRIGLEPASIGLDAVGRAVERRMKALQRRDPDAYLRLAESSSEEWARLVEEVVVPETWFFRDWEPFARLGRFAAETWPGLNSGRSLRVLSIPCATGEEPYSVAMALLDAGLPPHRFVVHGVDISEESLAKARRAAYGRNAFRGARLAFRDAYFTPLAPDTWQLNPEPRQPVRLSQGNLLDPGFLLSEPPYDVILCRNLLIYFDEAARERAFQTLKRLLAADGLLFSGHAEAVLVMRAGFVPMPWPGSFAYRRAPAQPPPAPAPAPSRKAPPPQAPAPPPRAAAPPAPFTVPQPQTPSPASRLDEAARLADQGRLDEALAICRQETRLPAAAPGAWRWQGVILEALGKPDEAAQCYEKAIYLDPTDIEAMSQLALALEIRGETERAAVLRRRRDRVATEAAAKGLA